MEIAERVQPPAAADAAGAVGAAGLRQAHALLRSAQLPPVPDDPYLGRELGRYFPRRSRSDSPMRWSSTGCDARSSPPSLTNSMINRGGPSLIVRIADADRRRAPDRSRPRLRGGARRLRPAGAQRRDQRARRQDARHGCSSRSTPTVQNLLLDRLVWFLRNVDLSQGLADRRRTIARASTSCRRARQGAAGRCRHGAHGADRELATAGVPERWRTGSPASRRSRAATDIVLIADRTKQADRRRSQRPISPPRRSSASTTS